MLTRLFKWFFERGSGVGAAIVRMVYGSIYLFILWDLHPVMNLVMGERGLNGSLDNSYFNLLNPFGILYRYDLPWQLEIWFWGSVVVSLLLVFGLFTRTAFILTYVSIAIFHVRNPYAIYGADRVLWATGIFLIFLNMGARCSLDAWIRKLRGRLVVPTIELWPLKAIQIQFAMIYLYTGLSKLFTERWREGSAVFYSVQTTTHSFWHGFDYTEYKTLFALMAYATLAIEIGFAFLVFNRKTRPLAIASAACLHFGIDLFMHIRFFSLMMYMGYLAFVEPAAWDHLAARCSVLGRRLSQSILRLTRLRGEARTRIEARPAVRP